jgi:hypothetical protein
MTTLRYGVFNVDRTWKVFRETERTGLFDSRDEALTAAKSAVRDALGAGFEVELYVEGPCGELRKADLSGVGH